MNRSAGTVVPFVVFVVGGNWVARCTCCNVQGAGGGAGDAAGIVPLGEWMRSHMNAPCERTAYATRAGCLATMSLAAMNGVRS